MSWQPGWQRRGSCWLTRERPSQSRRAAQQSIQTPIPIRGSSGFRVPPQMPQQGHGIPAQGSVAPR